MLIVSEARQPAFYLVHIELREAVETRGHHVDGRLSPVVEPFQDVVE